MDSEIGGKVGDQGILETRRQIYFSQEKVIEFEKIQVTDSLRKSSFSGVVCTILKVG